MKEQKKNRGLQKGLIFGPLIGGFLGFLVLFLLTGELPFNAKNTFGVRYMDGAIEIFYVYCVGGGAFLGFIVGAVIGSIVDCRKK